MQIDNFIKIVCGLNSKVEAELSFDYELFYMIKNFSVDFSPLRDKLLNTDVDKASFIAGLLYLFPVTKVLLNRIFEDFPEVISTISYEKVVDIFCDNLSNLARIKDKSLLIEKINLIKEQLNKISPEIIKLNRELEKLENDYKKKAEEKDALENNYKKMQKEYDDAMKIVNKLIPEMNKLKGELEVIKENSLYHLKRDEIEEIIGKIRDELNRVKEKYFPDDKAVEELNKKNNL